MQRTQKNSLSLKLKMIRIEAGKSQAELAEELNISRSSLANYETGKRKPDRPLLAKIADACHVKIDFLLESDPHHDMRMREDSAEKSAKIRKLIKRRGTALDISALPVEYQISMIHYYDYVLSCQTQNPEDEQTVLSAD